MPENQYAFTFPVCSKEKFAEVTGFSERYVQHLINQGLLPILPKSSPKAKVMINLEALRMTCHQTAQV
ncbi:hypothetical protein PCI56_23720 [Plesiomonas shigelloides subsp. oncorhynchi]|uniref:hypothetical protein n=1 Tax=Plesiomonas shigelloides TaxID=703 RepID=UPI001C49C3DB|nr:hypothetical protein [Plesiomonas shigelloides]MDA1381698.1 hypothetical protein [Plesiomonas shigelloides]